jgi:fructose-bisphosphate aldolase class II
MLVTLEEAIKNIEKTQAVPAFNVYGFEDAKVVLEVAKKLNAPAILMTNRDAILHMGAKNLCALLRTMGEEYEIPVCIHLDHGKSLEEIKKAIDAGFTSVMYDGSALPFEENIKNTLKVVEMAKKRKISVEAEIGCVGYQGIEGEFTKVDEAKKFYDITKVNALAVAVGTLHRMTKQEAVIDYPLLKEIEKEVLVPLVIHGSTGIKNEDLIKLSKTNIKKINIGTAVRMTFGKTLKSQFDNDEFDRIKLFKKPMEEIEKVILEKYKLLGF